jgi:integrase
VGRAEVAPAPFGADAGVSRGRPCRVRRWEGAPGDLVFTGRRGGVLRNLNFRRDHFDAAATAAGLDGLTPHELRHTAASLAVASGASVKAVQRMLGHASAL